MTTGPQHPRAFMVCSLIESICWKLTWRGWFVECNGEVHCSQQIRAVNRSIQKNLYRKTKLVVQRGTVLCGSVRRRAVRWCAVRCASVCTTGAATQPVVESDPPISMSKPLLPREGPRSQAEERRSEDGSPERLSVAVFVTTNLRSYQNRKLQKMCFHATTNHVITAVDDSPILRFFEIAGILFPRKELRLYFRFKALKFFRVITHYDKFIPTQLGRRPKFRCALSLLPLIIRTIR